MSTMSTATATATATATTERKGPKQTQACPACGAEVPAKKVARGCPMWGCGGWIPAEVSR